MNQHINLKRSVTLPMVILYGLGTIIGAGIFVLVGKVAGIAGIYTPFSFLLAAIIAGLTALSYAELSSRFPRSAGEAIYIEETFHLRWFSVIIGFAIAIAIIGIVSAATITNGSVGYIQVFIDLPAWFISTLIIIILTILAAWGIKESVSVAAFTTSISIIALLMIVFINTDNLLSLPQRLPELIPPMTQEVTASIMLGAFIAFYAFIGFEDMINIAEEVERPRYNMPKAIALTLLITTLLYVCISLTAILSVPVKILAASDAPLVTLIGESPTYVKTLIGLISIFAIADGILVQIIKTSRILFGMARQGMVPLFFSSVHPKTRTPIIATVTVAATILMLTISFPLLTLAQFTSFLTLAVFTVINFALWRLKLRPETKPSTYLNLPVWVPAFAFLVSTAFMLFQLFYLLNPNLQ